MAMSEYHDGRWLTSFGKDAKAGDMPCISCGHPLCGGEFTTYRLPEPVAMHPWNGPLFDLDDAEIRMPDGGFYARAEIEAIKASYCKSFVLGGHTYVQGGFGTYRLAAMAE